MHLQMEQSGCRYWATSSKLESEAHVRHCGRILELLDAGTQSRTMSDGHRMDSKREFFFFFFFWTCLQLVSLIALS
jgi:hypothetical protein